MVFDGIEFGLEAEAYGRRWIILKTLRHKDGFYLAVERDDELPAEVVLIQAEKIIYPHLEAEAKEKAEAEK